MGVGPGQRRRHAPQGGTGERADGLCRGGWTTPTTEESRFPWGRACGVTGPPRQMSHFGGHGARGVPLRGAWRRRVRLRGARCRLRPASGARGVPLRRAWRLHPGRIEPPAARCRAGRDRAGGTGWSSPLSDGRRKASTPGPAPPAVAGSRPPPWLARSGGAACLGRPSPQGALPGWSGPVLTHRARSGEGRPFGPRGSPGCAAGAEPGRADLSAAWPSSCRWRRSCRPPSLLPGTGTRGERCTSRQGRRGHGRRE